MMALTLVGSQRGVNPGGLMNFLQSREILGMFGCVGVMGEGVVPGCW